MGRKTEIRNILLVIFSGVAFGFLLVLFFLYQYGPSGQYIGKNVLLAPDVLQKLWYSDSNQKTGGKSRFIFASLTFSYRDPQTGQWETKDLDINQYGEFYSLIAQDKSSSENVEDLFSRTENAKISIRVKTEKDSDWQALSKVFQEVEIQQNGDFYRVALRENNPAERWIYFFHKDLFHEMLRIVKR